MTDTAQTSTSGPADAAPHPLAVWASQALTEFANGFFSGLPAGSGGGLGTAAGGTVVNVNATGSMPSADTLALLTVAGTVASALAHGMKSFLIWHHAHRMPNPFHRST